MEYPEFVRLVQNMRRLQVEYFTKGRTATQLREAKDAERRVDAAVRELTTARKEQNQPGLFDD